MASPTIPHLDWPVRVGGNGHLMSNEQDSIDDVASCVAISLLTARGFRIDEPEFGTRLDFPLMPVDLSALGSALERDEPRASLSFLDDPPSRQDLELRVSARLTLAQGTT